jgi:hypothetical protein
MWDRLPCMSTNDLKTASYGTRRLSNAIAEGPHSQIIVTYWNTTMQQNNIWAITFEAQTKEILKIVC